MAINIANANINTVTDTYIRDMMNNFSSTAVKMLINDS